MNFVYYGSTHISNALVVYDLYSRNRSVQAVSF